MTNVHEIRGGNGQGATARAPAGFREKPHSLEIEQLLLGNLLLNNDALALVRERLRPEHFYEPSHAALYAQTRDRIIAGRLADVDTLSIGMDKAGKEAMWRMAEASSTALPEDIHQRADEVIELWQRRRQIEIAEELSNASYDPEVQAGEWRSKVLQELADIALQTPGLKIAPPPHVDLSRLAYPVPACRFIISEWVPVGHITSIYGEGSSGKSFLAMMIGTCIAANIPWLGATVERCRVLCFFCEDSEDELLRREDRILRGLRLRWNDVAEHLFMIDRVGSSNAMVIDRHGTLVDGPAMAELLAKVEEIKPRVIILDNIAHIYGGNENDRFAVTSFLNRLAAIARQIDGAIILLGHPPKSESDYSGSTAWSNNVRSRLTLKKLKDDEDRWTLERAKSNYADAVELPLVLDPSTGLVRPDDPAYESEECRLEMQRKLGAARQCILEALDLLNEREEWSSEAKTASNYLPRIMAVNGLANGHKTGTLERALKSLMKDGFVVRAVVGRYTKGSMKYGLVRARSQN